MADKAKAFICCTHNITDRTKAFICCTHNITDRTKTFICYTCGFLGYKRLTTIKMGKAYCYINNNNWVGMGFIPRLISILF